jgi:DNA mismatch endonuclease, patch repair protein
MPDRFPKKTRSFIMSRIRSTNTGIEKLVFRKLKASGIRFKKHYKKITGTPDVASPKKKIAIFIDGDFWHGFGYPSWKGRLHSAFWRSKIERNRARDRRTFAKLRREGWKVARVWEHELLEDPDRAIGKIRGFITSQ